MKPREFLVCTSFLALLHVVPAAQQPSLEYDVRAAFVLNFARYVEWPPDERTPPLQICLLASNPFGNRLEAVVSGEQWNGGAISVRVVPEIGAAGACHLLYVPEADSTRFAQGLSAIAGLPVLTVGEEREFLAHGGMIRLFLENNRVRFSVNQKAADAAGLHVSSRLLRLAREVIGPTGWH